MADPKITFPELPDAAALTGSELVPLWQTSGVVKATLAQVVTFAGGLINSIARDQGGGLLVGGTANALTVTPNQATWALADGANVAFRAASANTGAATLNVNGTGARSLVKGSGTALVAGDLVAGQVYEAVYVAASTHFRLRAGVIPPSVPAVTAYLTAGTNTYTIPAGARALRVRGVGPGGAGGAAPNANASENVASAGGGSGGYVEHLILNPTGNYTAVVGAPGSDSTFTGAGAALTAGAGATGTAGASAGTGPRMQPGGAGGTASGGSIANVPGNPGGNCVYGGNVPAVGGPGGGCPLGSGGLGAVNAVGGNATGNGGGGAGGASQNAVGARAGGSGAPGAWIIEALF